MSKLDRLILLRQADIEEHNDEVCIDLEPISIATVREESILDHFVSRYCRYYDLCQDCLFEDGSTLKRTAECLE